ncbi:MAG: MFS transporter [Chloroflexota bacterium]
MRRTPFYYGWVVAGAASATMMLTGTFAAPIFGVFIEPWTAEFGWSRTAISGGFSFATVVAALVGPLAGRGLDRYGGRLFLGGGALVMAVSLLVLSRVSTLVGLYLVFSVGRSAMMTIQNLAAHTVVANWFVRRRAFASALALNGSRVGLAVWPLVAAGVSAAAGWRTAMVVMGVSIGILALVPLVLVVARRPEQVGLLPDGAARAPVPGANRAAPEQRQWAPREALRTRAFWLLMSAHMAAMVAGGGMGVHRIPYFVAKGLDEALVGLFIVAFAVGMGIGGFFAAAAVRWVPVRRVIGISLAGAAGSTALILLVPGNALAVGYGFLDGLFAGGMFALLPVVYADYYGRNAIGTIRGITHPAVVTANAVGPLIAGVVFDVMGGYTYAFLAFGLVLVAGASASWLAVPPAVDSASAEQQTGPV